MTPRLLLALVGLFASSNATGAEPAARVQASLATKGDVWVGQRVTLVVELFAPGFFAAAPAFELPQVPGVVIAKPEDRPTLDSKTIDDVSYTVQRHEFAVYAQRAGTVTIPGFVARFEANERFGAPAKAYSVTTPAVKYVAKMPPGAEKLATVITTRSLTVKETWAPEPGAAKVGAAFTRTITVEARDVPGMVLPSFAFAPPDGLRAYPKPPEVSDSVNRGELTGRRVETVTYVCEEPGRYELPALVLAWWNPEAQKLSREKLPARTFDVTAPPTPPAAVPVTPAPEPRSRWWLVAIGAGVVALGLLGWRFAPALASSWKRYRARAAESEGAYFAAFERACRTGDAHATYRALVAWLDRFAVEPRVETLDDFARRAGDPQLSAEFTALRDAAFKPGADGSTRPRPELAHRVRIARKQLSHTARARRHEPALPPLNPT
jgi:hypothetical protein